MANIYKSRWDASTDEWSRARLGAQAGCEQLGLSLYELAPGQRMVFHYHLQNEELLIALRGRPTLRTFEGERELAEGDVVAFPRGQAGAHGFENRTDEPVHVLLFGELNVPNVSVYPDTEEIGVFDARRPADRRFGGLFRLKDASDYGSAKPKIPPPA
jgi:uncharacterized cupin superfamily protein